MSVQSKNYYYYRVLVSPGKSLQVLDFSVKCLGSVNWKTTLSVKILEMGLWRYYNEADER